MGIALKEHEIVYDDLFFGLTQKYLNADYYTAKNDIIDYLRILANQIDNYLGRSVTNGMSISSIEMPPCWKVFM